MPDPTKQSIENLIDEGRVLSFSDSVFAFAATLLVLKIDLPQLDGSTTLAPQLLQALPHLWPQYFANIISFLIIGYYWLNHHAIFGLVKKYNNAMVWTNLIFLIALSFLPFPIDLFGDYSSDPSIIAFYSASLALVGFLLFAILYIAAKQQTVSENISPRHLGYYLIRNLIAPMVFTLSIPLAFIDPNLAKLSWFFVIILILLLNFRYKYKKLSEIEKMLT